MHPSLLYCMSGVGKSETAYRLAEAVLAKHVRAGSSKKSFPAGLLTLYGQDFSDGSLHEVCMYVMSSPLSDDDLC